MIGIGWVAPKELVDHARTPVRSSGVVRQHDPARVQGHRPTVISFVGSVR